DMLSTAEEAEARHHQWELRHHPERFLDLAEIPSAADRATAEAAVVEKRRWIAAEPTPETARIRCQAIRAANETLQHFVGRELQKSREIASDSHAKSRTAELLSSREYSAFLFPEKDLRNFLLAIAVPSR
ncbi:MAG: hypothetical protein JNK76_26730, partial [Planctomycetales bacterium]|nr:hypothetical protein [Planctomycetales bacterium]